MPQRSQVCVPQLLSLSLFLDVTKGEVEWMRRTESQPLGTKGKDIANQTRTEKWSLRIIMTGELCGLLMTKSATGFYLLKFYDFHLPNESISIFTTPSPENS